MPRLSLPVLPPVLSDPDDLPEQRPRTRGDCAGAARPCPWASCRFSLALDVHPHTGRLTTYGDPSEMSETCALDLADRGPSTLDEVADLMGVSRQRIQQLELIALRKLATRRDPKAVKLRAYREP